MNNPIPEPLRGADVIAWAQPVTRALNALSDKVGATARNERDRRDVQPRPFEVRFDASLDSGDGGWKIYLPTSHLLLFDGEYVAVTGGVTAISATPGWYELGGIDLSDTHVWLVVTTAASQGSTATTAAFAASAGTAGVSAKVVNVCIAELSYTAATSSTPASVSIHQSIVGALTLANADTPAGTATPDDISIDDDGTGGALEIKDWSASTRPESPTTVAADLRASTASTDEVIVRDSSGNLKYKSLGQLGDIMSCASDMWVVVNVEWVTSGAHAYSIAITRKKLVADGNKLQFSTAAADTDVTYLETVPHSSL